jgi:hypothetical protein
MTGNTFCMQCPLSSQFGSRCYDPDFQLFLLLFGEKWRVFGKKHYDKLFYTSQKYVSLKTKIFGENIYKMMTLVMYLFKQFFNKHVLWLNDLKSNIISATLENWQKVIKI